ncbi:hypothetical protein HMPREF9446_01956 [Bacteroides fluxus YIT 12057]|uniref:Uncharacterized protein n=1 Tax=Bacteroides fluxus YIT 12057 TaxID=763034 RepID=F3PT90_9BACE|nr:hypothetical protein HMPREF9446_01956 [Bacteroides fluxus YIT 12057]
MPAFCRPIGKVLPVRWQGFAYSLAKFCQSGGNSLPKRWQNFAKRMASFGKIESCNIRK